MCTHCVLCACWDKFLTLEKKRNVCNFNLGNFLHYFSHADGSRQNQLQPLATGFSTRLSTHFPLTFDAFEAFKSVDSFGLFSLALHDFNIFANLLGPVFPEIQTSPRPPLLLHATSFHSLDFFFHYYLRDFARHIRGMCMQINEKCRKQNTEVAQEGRKEGNWRRHSKCCFHLWPGPGLFFRVGPIPSELQKANLNWNCFQLTCWNKKRAQREKHLATTAAANMAYV